MKSLTKTQVCNFLQTHDNFIIISHRRPDGDTAGSSAALCLGLRKLGKTAYVLENPELTPKYAPLHQGLTQKSPAEGDTLICVDVASAGMLPDAFAPYKDRITLRLDHHATADGFTPYSLVEADAAATGEIIYDILMELGVPLDTPIADALYTAISTDTGGFRFANTRPHTFLVASELSKVSPNLYDLNQVLFGTVSLAKLRLQGWMVENALFLQDGKIAICPIPLEIEQSLGCTEDDMDNISGFPRSIQGVVLAATIRQESPQKVKLSLRAAPGYDAGAICAHFGGGGHKGAAGASMEMTMAEAVSALRPLLESAI